VTAYRLHDPIPAVIGRVIALGHVDPYVVGLEAEIARLKGGESEHSCFARASGVGYECTLSKGHGGDHVAHGARNQEVARWPQ
jgi:hypothetical protein